jgi:dihydroorotase
MKTLFKSALILDPRSPHHGKKRDVLIDKGTIVSIAASLPEEKAKVVKEKGLVITTGFIDLQARFGEPGHEYKEDFSSGIAAAKAGGYTRIALLPSTTPPVDNKASVDFMKRKGIMHDFIIHPIGTLSDKREGKQLSEMFDMKNAGAVAFSDDKQSVSTELMARALEYTQNFDGLVMSFPLDPGVNPGAQVHEGPTSTRMGMKGLSHASEEIRLSRDLDLLRYLGGRLHVSLISTAKSVDLIRKAKKEGLQVTCAIAAHQLSFLDEDMMGFDTHLKVLPPFRTKEDRKALIAGLKDGTIDAICSDHTPEDVEHKQLEFEHANFGMNTIQHAFPIAYTALADSLDLETIVSKFTAGPRAILRADQPVIEAGQAAEITIFSTDAETTVSLSKKEWMSKTGNTGFEGKGLKGKMIK